VKGKSRQQRTTEVSSIQLLPYIFCPEVARQILTGRFGEYRQNGYPGDLGLYTALGGDVIKRTQECRYKFLLQSYLPRRCGVLRARRFLCGEERP
jgi:hypothetical protein